jgi:hypothetical protein
MHVDVTAEHEVVQHRHAPEERDVLEGARHPERGDAGGGEVGDVGAFQHDAARVGVIEAADHVEQRGLPRSVGADYGHEIALLDVQAHARHRLHAAEGLGDVADLELRAHDSHRFRRR